MDQFMDPQVVPVTLFGFLAVGAIALFSFISVAHWISTRQQERETRERFALMKLLLEHPGDEGTRVLAAWREQEARADVRGRRERLIGGVVTLAVGVALGTMLRIMSPESGAWSVGLIPGLVGTVIAAVAYFERSAGVESRA
jgi:hypothetical protein